MAGRHLNADHCHHPGSGSNQQRLDTRLGHHVLAHQQGLVQIGDPHLGRINEVQAFRHLPGPERKSRQMGQPGWAQSSIRRRNKDDRQKQEGHP